MIFSNYNRHTQLQRELKLQIQSLFIGTVVNDTNLCEYAEVKRLANYRGGYTYDTLCIMQKNIDAIKSVFPKQYADFRGELFHQLANPRNETKFSICDRYIKAFLTIDFCEEKSVYDVYRQFCGGYDDRY